jgi:hypothetical protein
VSPSQSVRFGADEDEQVAPAAFSAFDGDSAA